jgi:hypothetical protein
MAEQSQRERITQYARDVFGTEAEYLWAVNANLKL